MKPEREAQPQHNLLDAVEVQRRDIAALHEKMSTILTTIRGQGQVIKKNAADFYDNIQQTSSDNNQQVKGSCRGCGKLITSTAPMMTGVP